LDTIQLFQYDLSIGDDVISDDCVTSLQSMSRDILPVSVRLRNSAIQAIAEVGRPLAVHEIEEWLKANNPAISQELTTKCYDYVRIILSLSPIDILVKYRPLIGIDGVDHRALFYGLTSKKYDPQMWLRTQVKHCKSKRNRSPDSSPDPRPPSRRHRAKPATNPAPPSPPPKVLLFADAPAIPLAPEVDSVALENAWNTLACVTLPDAPLWKELLIAMNEVKTEIETGTAIPDAVQGIIRDHAAFVHPLVAHDVAVILTKEACARKEEILSASDYGFWGSW
jgi:hypothetical protein